jgi:membrane-associated phospholipid phosphatase
VNDLPDEIAPVAWLPMQAGALAYPLVLSAGIYWRTKTPQPALSIAAAGVSASVASVASDRMGPIPGVASYGAATAASLSRLYVGAHLPLDIVGGAAFGVVVGEIVEVAVLRIQST